MSTVTFSVLESDVSDLRYIFWSDGGKTSTGHQYIMIHPPGT